MRRHVRSILIVLLCISALAIFAACGADGGDNFQDRFPDKGDSGQIREKTPIGLKINPSSSDGGSLFHTAYVGEFSYEGYTYQIKYKTAGGGYEYGEPQPLKEENISEESKALFNIAGKHYIVVTAKDGDVTLTGHFELNLRERADVEKCRLTIDLAGGVANIYGADTTTVPGSVIIDVTRGKEFSYGDFVSKYFICKEGMALSGFMTDGELWSVDSQEKLVFDGDKTLTAQWTDNLLTVEFDANLPDGIVPAEGSIPPSQRVPRNSGTVIRPDIVKLTESVSDYYFSGWSTDVEGRDMWNFNMKVGASDMTLYAQWRVKEYSLELFFMGGAPDVSIMPEITDDTNVQAVSEFQNGLAYKVTIDGIVAGTPYSECIADITLSNGADPVIVRANVADLSRYMKKGGGVYVPAETETSDGWYEDASDRNKGYRLDAAHGDVTLYLQWDVNADGGDMNDFYISYLFKDGFELQADGSVRITKLYDYTANEVILPYAFEIDGIEHPVSAIADGAFRNSPALLKVDMSAAAALTNIGANAFANCSLLKEIIFPDSVSFIGQNAMTGTAWLNAEADRLSADGGSGVAAVGGIAVKYFGKDTSFAIPADIESVAAGCFSDALSLKEVILPTGLKRIEDRAFYGAASLEKVSAPSDPAISFIGAESFMRTPFLDLKKGADSAGNIIIGNMYYRFAGTASEAVVPAGITAIAPRAFASGSGVNDIVFEDIGKIRYFGADAFTDTAWMYASGNKYVDNGCLVINGMMLGFAGVSATAEVPAGVNVIAENAFGSSSYRVNNIVIPASVTKIESGAFSGAERLNAIVFSHSAVDPAPSIQADSFEMSDSLRFYFTDAGILDNLKDNTSEWGRLYASFPDAFEVTAISSVAVDTTKFDTVFLNGKGSDYKILAELRNKYGDFIEDAVIVKYNNGINVREDMDISDLSMTGISAGTYNGIYNYDKATVSEPFAYTVHETVNGAEVYDGTDETISDGNSADAPIKLRGLRDVYYTSEKELPLAGVTAVYETGHDSGVKEEIIEITEDMVTGYFSTVGEHTLTVTINYHGLAVYKVKFTYRSAIAGLASVSQDSIFSMPIGSDSKAYSAGMLFTVTYQDGKTVKVNAARRDLTITGVYREKEFLPVTAETLDTDRPGYRRARVSFTANKESIESDFFYIVTFDEDTTGMDFVPVGDSEAKLSAARISSGREVVIVPSEVTIAGKKYAVTQIGEKAFENSAFLKRVYIPSSVKEIGDYAFSGCSALQFVGSFLTYDAEADEEANAIKVTAIADSALKAVGGTVTGDVTVKINNISNEAFLSDRIVMPKGAVRYSDSVVHEDGYPVERNYNVTFTFEAKTFAGYIDRGGAVYLYDTPENRAFAAENDGFEIYTDEDGFVQTDINVFGIENTSAEDKNITVSRDFVIKEGALAADFVSNNANGLYLIGDILKDEETASGREVHRLIGYEQNALTDLLNKIDDATQAVFIPDNFTVIPNISHTDDSNLVVYDADKYPRVEIPVDVFPRSVERVGRNAFAGCTSLSDLRFSIDSALKELGMYAFSGSGIVSIDLSETKLTEIDAHVFYGCNRLEKAVLPGTVVVIGNDAFSGCTALSELTADYGAIEYVGSYAFYLCRRLDIGENSFTDPEVVIGNNAFDK